VLRAIREAHEAVAAAPIAYGDDPPPGTTIVAALVVQRWLTVGWVGDSRAYWIGQNDAELCTRDHSWLNDVVSRGAMSEADAAVSPFAHALTRCLGPLETGCEPFADVHPDVMSMALPGPGHLILCSDGLWNYLPHALAVAEVVRLAGPHADATAVARLLVCHALAAGGGDNVSVAVQTLT
jgi:serine/threonine protein phosphatase PrpC